jgi:hypothetical protein
VTETSAVEPEATPTLIDATADQPKAATPQQSATSSSAETTAVEPEATPIDATADDSEAIASPTALAEASAQTSAKSSPRRWQRNIAHGVAAISVLMLIAYAVYDLAYFGFLQSPSEWLLFVAVYGAGVFLPIYKGVYWRVRHDRDKVRPRIAHWVAMTCTLALGGFLLLSEKEPTDQILVFLLFGYLACYWAVRGTAWATVKLLGASDAVRVT